MEVLKFHHEGADGFYKDLIWTFHQVFKVSSCSVINTL